MNTLETDVEVNPDGSLKLLSPLPEWLKPGLTHMLLVVPGAATLEKPKREIPTATPGMIAQRMASFERLREMNPYRDITDTLEWQREVREDVVLPGRE